MLSTFLSRPQTFCCTERCRANTTHTSSPLREEWWNPQRSWAAGNSWPRQRSSNLYCDLWLLLANAVHYSFRIQADGSRRGEDNKPHQAPKRIQVVLAYSEGLWPLGKPYLPPTKRRLGCMIDDVREVMPHCVIKDVRNRWPNPPNVPYQGHRRSWKCQENIYIVEHYRALRAFSEHVYNTRQHSLCTVTSKVFDRDPHYYTHRVTLITSPS